MATNGTPGTAVTKFDPARFTAVVSNLKKAAASSRVGFLKMGKDGAWSFGSDEQPITEEDHIFIDFEGFVHGWQCWADTDLPGVASELLGDVKAPMDQPMPDKPATVPANGRQWAQMVGMSVAYMGEKLVYTTTSVGGLNALSGLGEEYLAQGAVNSKALIAEVSLSCDSYKHKNKTYGRIYTPVFTVVAWHESLPDHAAVKAVKVDLATGNAATKKVAAKKAPAKAAKKR